MIINKLIYLSGFITRYINFKYFYNFNGIITLFVSKKKIVKIKLNSDTNFSFLLKDPYYNRLIYPKYKYEPEIEFLLQKLKKINFLFMDVGANFGLWSLFAAKINVNAKVYSFEPVTISYNNFVENIKLNNTNNIIPNKFGLSNKNEEL